MFCMIMFLPRSRLHDKWKRKKHQIKCLLFEYWVKLRKRQTALHSRAMTQEAGVGPAGHWSKTRWNKANVLGKLQKKQKKKAMCKTKTPETERGSWKCQGRTWLRLNRYKEGSRFVSWNRTVLLILKVNVVQDLKGLCKDCACFLDVFSVAVWLKEQEDFG